MGVSYDIYLMPGLGLDYRVFENLSLSCGTLIPMHWLEPEPEEDLTHYVSRMATQITRRQNPFVLIGHSFGGIVVQELQALVHAERLVIISSIAASEELPAQLAMLKYIKLHYLLRSNWLRKSVRYWGGKHGYDTDTMKAILAGSVAGLSSYYFHWSVEQIIHWAAPATNCPVLRIHGTHDKTFPQVPNAPTIILEKGDHLLVYKQGPEISLLIEQWLQESY